jgi:hypothetical protein
MLWAALIIGALVVIGCTSTLGLIAYKALQTSSQVSRDFISAHQATLNSLERTHDRNVKQNEGVLDRFMALDFSLFKAYQSAEDAPVGGFEPPDEEEEGSMRTYLSNDRYIEHGTSVADRLRAAAEERTILAEDFDDEFLAREDAR